MREPVSVMGSDNCGGGGSGGPYRRIAALLRQEGWEVGKRLVQRWRREEGLRVTRTRRKTVRGGESTGLPTQALHRGHVWTWDFIADATVRGGALEEGQRVLIHGAAGGVGVFAVQLARWKGAEVFATASAVNIDFVRSLGAHHVIDYQAKRFEDVLPRMDVVFDAVGGETLDRSWTVLLASGRLVSVASNTEATPDPRNKAAFMLVRADSGQLNQISRLIDEGILRVFVAGILALENAKDAYLRAMRGKMRGKICLRVVAEALAVENNKS